MSSGVAIDIVVHVRHEIYQLAHQFYFVVAKGFVCSLRGEFVAAGLSLMKTLMTNAMYM